MADEFDEAAAVRGVLAGKPAHMPLNGKSERTSAKGSAHPGRKTCAAAPVAASEVADLRAQLAHAIDTQAPADEIDDLHKRLQRAYRAKRDCEPSSVRIRHASEIAAKIPRSAWLLRPFIERNAIAILYGDYGTYKSFVAIDWAMRIALGIPALGYSWDTPSTAVLLISAEGRGLAQRLRGWCIRNFPGEDYATILARTPLYCIEHPVNLSDPTSALALVARVDEMAITPGLIIIDTMTRNSDGRIEFSTTDAAAYLSVIDQGLRSRYGCAVLLTHHVGHVEKGRIRGPIVLAANTDALIRIERPENTQRKATLTVERLKDCDPPPPQGLEADVIEVGESDDDNQPITTLTLSVSAMPIVAPRKKGPTGRNQQQLLAGIREYARVHGTDVIATLDLRDIAKAQGLDDRRRFGESREALERDGWIVPCIGGYRLQGDSM